MNNKNKRIFITEAQADELNKKMKVNIKTNFPVDPEKVKVIAKYLKNGFKKGRMNCLGADGYPSSVPIALMIGLDGQPLKNMTAKQLFYLLQDRFLHIYDDNNRRDSLLLQVMKDWYNDKISPEGLLSVNLLKEDVNEGWKNLAMAGIMGLTSLGTNAQTQTNDTIQSNVLQTDVAKQAINKRMKDVNADITADDVLNMYKPGSMQKYMFDSKLVYNNLKKALNVCGNDTTKFYSNFSGIDRKILNFWAKGNFDVKQISEATKLPPNVIEKRSQTLDFKLREMCEPKQ